MRDLLGLRIALTSLGVLLVAVFAVAAGYDTALLLGAILASTGTIALVVQHTYTIPLTAALRLATISALELARQALTVAAIVALVLFGAGVLPLLAVALAANLCLIPPTAALAHNEIALGFSMRSRNWLALLKLTVSFSLATAVGSIYIYTAQIITSLVASEHQSGLFAASFRIFLVLAAVPPLLVGGALPLLARAARDDRERLGYAMQRIFEASLVLGTAAALGAVAGARFMIAVVAGPKYVGSVAVLQIQGVALVATFALAGWSFALLSLRRYRQLLFANLAAFLVSCSLTVVLASGHGALGAAIASVCGEGVLAIGCLLALLHSDRELRPRLAVLPKLALATLPALAVALWPALGALVRPLLALAVYTLIVLATRAVPEEVIALLPRRMRGVR